VSVQSMRIIRCVGLITGIVLAYSMRIICCVGTENENYTCVGTEYKNYTLCWAYSGTEHENKEDYVDKCSRTRDSSLTRVEKLTLASRGIA